MGMPMRGPLAAPMTVPVTGVRVLERSASLRGLKALFRRKDARLGPLLEGDAFGAGMRSVSASGSGGGAESERKRRAESLKGMISAPRVVSMGGVGLGEGGEVGVGAGSGLTRCG